MSSGIPNAFSAMHQDHSGSLRFLDASFSARAVRSDPAAVSSHLALDGDLLLPSSHYDPVRELSLGGGIHLRPAAWLRLCRCLERDGASTDGRSRRIS